MASTSTFMKAVLYESYGGGSAALKHAEVPILKPKDDEVLLKVEAVSLNPFDWKIQNGVYVPFILATSLIVHECTDVAGEVLEVGAGVKRLKAGDKVVTLLNHATGGGLAEYVVAKETSTIYRPPEVTAVDGAALPLAALTAHQALIQAAGINLDETSPQSNILITAASGGVGHYAVQLAKLGNAHVTATCGARNIEFVKSLGADEVINYKTSEGATLKSPSGRKYDVVIHCASEIPWSVFEPNLSSNGKVIDITPANASTVLTFIFKKLTFSKKKLVPLWGMSFKSENLSYVLNLVKEGKVKSVIDSRYHLSKAEDAWAKSMDGHATGKIIVEP